MAHHDIVRRETSKTKAAVSSAVSRATPFVTKDLLYTLALALAAIGIVSLSSWFVATDPFHTDEETQKILSELSSRAILASEVIGEGKDARVAYSYKGGRVPEKLSQNEVAALRTPTSFTSEEGKDATGRGIYTVVAYARPAFLQEEDGWYYIEYDQAPKELFLKIQTVRERLARLMVPVVRAETFYAAAGDGKSSQVLATDWASARSATAGIITDSVNATFFVQTAVYGGKIPGATISRVFIPFNTSAIPAAATITAATLGVYATSTAEYPADAWDYITVVRTSQATHTTLVDADYDNIGTTEGIASGNRKEVSAITLDAYATFPLNATGIGWIAKSGVASNCSSTNGITCLGLRDGHDLENVAPTVDATQTLAEFSSSESTGTSQDPYLAVTYSAPFAFWQFDIF
jgi:hypothetical protein